MDKKREKPLQKYIDKKIHILINDFKVDVPTSDFDRICEAKNRIQVDNITRSILKKALNGGQV